MHPVILLAGMDNGGDWPWTSRSFWSFWLRILGRKFGWSAWWIWARVTKIWILVFSQLVLKMQAPNLDVQGHLAFSTAFNIALVYWSRPASVYYTSQTCCCIIHTCLFLLIPMLWHRQAIFKSKGDKLSSSAECRIWTRVFGTESPAECQQTECPRLSYRRSS